MIVESLFLGVLLSTSVGASLSFYPPQCSSSGQTMRVAGVYEAYCNPLAGGCDYSGQLDLRPCPNGAPLRDADVRITGYQIERSGGSSWDSHTFSMGFTSSVQVFADHLVLELQPEVTWLISSSSSEEVNVKIGFEVIAVTQSYYSQILRSALKCKKTGFQCSGSVVAPNAVPGSDVISPGGLKFFSIRNSSGSSGTTIADFALAGSVSKVGQDAVTSLNCTASTNSLTPLTACQVEVVSIRASPQELETAGVTQTVPGPWTHPQTSLFSQAGLPASVALCGMSGFSMTQSPFDRLWGLWAGLTSSSCVVLGPNTITSYSAMSLLGKPVAHPPPYSVFSVLNATDSFEFTNMFDASRLK